MKGIVIKSTGSWYIVLADNKEKIECRIKGNFRMKEIKTTNPIAVGDRVVFEKEADKDKGVITEIEKRKNYIIRKSINLSKQTHIIAANVDQAFLMVTLAQPKTSAGFIDRFLITAEAYGIPVIIIFNKIDIYSEKEKKELEVYKGIYEKIGYKCLSLSAIQKKEIIKLKAMMKNKINLIAGHSGVGKSTLINSLDEGLKLKIGKISQAHHKGIHTTTFAEMHELEDNIFIIDTPGVKELGLVDINKNEVSHYFHEMHAMMNQCKFNNCLHMNEPKCAIIEAVNEGRIAESRYHSYLSIMHGEELEKEYGD